MTTKNKKIAVGFTLIPLLLLFLWVSSSTLFAQSSSPGSTLSTPHPYGVKFSAGIFDMQISDVDLDAWPEIEAENQFNVKFSAGIFDMQISDVDLDAWPEIEAENQFNDL